MSCTGRDGWLMAKALAIALRQMKAEKYPAHSDIEDMDRLLEFHGWKKLQPVFEMELDWKAKREAGEVAS